ncbi:MULTISPECIES: acyl carrier protein [Arcicella]|uniref:Acyl carrier protein n=1 Tax=Arcicella aquatica TaxID=217141 RepID=A0ABU5QIA7_9BACT|nr:MULTISPECIES: acyl carrier protein [Arcicella]MDR6563372.1 acyl carrier protein [Arcicella sp. BE51]MDR6813207.1 acyl carrier protein [Arcicella sp. BE140]MDR6824521.1 acyl carrier protein [Arcicella sp. BE139]MEA5256771.1 acyl carrier protein [Arcicella aquatica]
MKFNTSKLIQFLSRNFYINPRLIAPQKRFYADLGMNSLEFLELIVYLENTYGIVLPDNEVDKIQTIKQLSEVMEANLVRVEA